MRVVALSVLICGCVRGGFTSPWSQGDGAADRPVGRFDADRLDASRLDRPGGADGGFLEGPPLPTSILFTIQRDQDDGEAMDAGPTWFPQGEPSLGLTMGAWDNGYAWSFFRFALTPAIAPGSTVCDARLELNGKSIDPPQAWQGSPRALRGLLGRLAVVRKPIRHCFGCRWGSTLPSPPRSRAVRVLRVVKQEKRRPKPVSVEVPSAHGTFVMEDPAAAVPAERSVAPGPLWGGRIRPTEEVGRGATGTVLRGTDVKLRRDVALKVTTLPRGQLPTHLYARFVEEVQITAQLEHPNVVPVHDFGVDPAGRAYFSMKLVRGQSLQTILDKKQAGDPATVSEFGLRRLLDVFLQVCQAIEYAHACGVIHRDLKPANIMVGDFGEVLVMDWGIAKLISGVERSAQPGLDSAAAQSRPSVSSMRAEAGALATQHGVVIGTPAYMSPEQARGANVDERSDIYSLGVILYEILCGRVPFDSKDPMQTLRRQLSETPRAPSEIDPHAPPMLEVIALQLLEKDPAKRTLSVGHIRSSIHDYIEGIGHEYRRERVWTNALWVAGAIGLFAFFIWYLTGQSIATVVALTPSTVFNAIGWFLVVMAVGYPLWGATTAFATRTKERDRFRPPTSAELFVSGFLAHRTFSAAIAPLFQLVFVVETFTIAYPTMARSAFAQLRGEWAHALIVIIVFLFTYLFLFSTEVRFARGIDRYVRLLRRPAWESVWPFVLIVVLLSTVIATDVLDWRPSGSSGNAWAYINDRILAPPLHPFSIVKTLVFQGTFLIGLVIAAILLSFPFAELLASLRMTYQPVDQASIADRKRYFLRSLATFRIARTNFLYAGAMIGSLTGLTILSERSRDSLIEQVVYVLGPSLIGFLGFALIRRKTATHLAGASAVRQLLVKQLALAREEHMRADLEQLQLASWRRRLLQLTVPIACVVGYLVWTESGIHQEALRELVLPVSAKGWLLILPYALLFPLLLVRDPVHVWILRRRVRALEQAVREEVG